MLIWVPSIASITFGKALVVAKPIKISSHLLPSGQIIKRGANFTIAVTTLLTAYNAVALATQNFSHIDLLL